MLVKNSTQCLVPGEQLVHNREKKMLEMTVIRVLAGHRI